ncbi:MAG: molybdopterin guanine dinucleotide synthesis [Paracoccaceae bacterium]
MSWFGSVLIVDWSGGRDTGARPRKDAIWACLGRRDGVEPPVYLRNRAVAEDWLVTRIGQELSAGRRVLAGFDFPFGYPSGFAAALTGRADPLAVWDWVERHLPDGTDGTDRFDLAGRINARFPGTGPFWGNGLKRDIPHLPRKGRARQGHGMTEWRLAEKRAPGAFSCWQLSGAGAVGSQTLTGLPVLARLRRRFGAAAWPFEPPDAALALVEIWPSLLAGALRDLQAPGEIRDAAQVRVLAGALMRLAPERLARLLAVEAPEAVEEGWILGLGAEAELEAAARAAAR